MVDNHSWVIINEMKKITYLLKTGLKFSLIFVFIIGLSPVYALASISIPVGINPRTSFTVDNKVYALNQGDGTVSVINPDTNSVTATLTVGNTPIYSANVGHKLYVKNTGTGSVSVIDTVTNGVSSIILGGSLSGITAVGNKVYVSRSTGNRVSVIDTQTDTVEASIVVGTAPRSFAVVGTKVYVNNSTSNNISVINSLTNSVIATIPSVGNNLNSIIIPVGEKLYVSDIDGGAVVVIDTTTDTVIDTIITGNEPSEYAFVYGTKLFVGDPINSDLFVIDTLTDTLVDTIPTADAYYSYLLGKRAYASNYGSTSVTVIDPENNTVIESLVTGTGPAGMTVIDEKNLYVGNYFNNTVSVIDSTTVDSLLPDLVSFSTNRTSGRYAEGDGIKITANFGRNIQAGSTMTVLLNNGASVDLNIVLDDTISGTYNIGSGEETPDLSISEITSANVTDSTGSFNRTSYDLPSSVGSFDAENSLITRSLGDSKNIAIGYQATIDVGSNPYQVSSPVTIGDNQYIYVANQGSDNVSVINKSTGDIAATVSVGSEPYGLTTASVSGTTYVYVANIGSDTVSVINTSTNTVVATVSVGVKPYYVAAIGTNIYVTNGASNSVSVIDGNSNTVTATISVGSYPRGIKAHGTDLYVANYGDLNYSGGNYISVINSLDNTVSDTIILPAGSSGPRGVMVNGSKVYVANFRSNNVSVINTNTNAVIDTIDVGMGPRGMASVGDNVYVENFDAGTISVINTNTDTVTDTIVVGHSPSGMGVSGTDIYVSSFQDDRVYILDTLTNELHNIGFSFTGPTEGYQNNPSATFTVAPDYDFVGDVTITPSGGGLTTPIVLSFADSTPQNFTITPTLSGTVTLTLDYDGSVLTYLSSREPQVSSGSRPRPSAVVSVANPALSLANPPAVTPTVCYTFTTFMNRGSKFGEVKNLQTLLNSLGFDSGTPDGLYGQNTEKAVKGFQESHGIIKAGYVGPKTRAALNASCVK